MKFGTTKRAGASSGTKKITKKHVEDVIREAAGLPKQTTTGKQLERDAVSKLNAGLLDLAHQDAEACLAEARKASGIKDTVAAAPKGKGK